MMISTIALLAGMSMVHSSAATGQDLRVLLVAAEDSAADLEYSLTKEVGVMRGLLEEAGFQVVVASASGQPFVADTTTLTPDLTYGDVNVADYAGIIMPCLALYHRAEPPELTAIIREAVAQGKPVAAQTGAVFTLAKAGVLSGKRYALVQEWVAQEPALEDGIYSGHGIVKDGNIITSGVCPVAAKMVGLEDGTSELTQALIAELAGES
jgi:putative intracellular protease/amidase